MLVAPERHVLYRYSHSHDNDAVDRLLGGYKGYLVADAATVYDHLYKTGDVVEVACWAHTRRWYPLRSPTRISKSPKQSVTVLVKPDPVLGILVRFQ